MSVEDNFLFGLIKCLVMCFAACIFDASSLSGLILQQSWLLQDDKTATKDSVIRPGCVTVSCFYKKLYSICIGHGARQLKANQFHLLAIK